MGYKLETGYTEQERINFIVEYNHNQGLTIGENEHGLFAISENEEVQNGEIVNVSDTDEYISKLTEQENAVRKSELQAQIYELDLKRIRALAEGGAMEDGTSYLDYYNNQISALRAELNNLF